MESNAKDFEPITEFVKVPSLVTAFKCGFDQKYYSGDMEFVLIPGLLLRNIVEPYVVVAAGDSMTPEINDGDTLIVDRKGKTKHRDFIVCRLNDQFLIKQLIINNYSTYLKSTNDKYELRQVLPDDDFEILGRIARIIIEK